MRLSNWYVTQKAEPWIRIERHLEVVRDRGFGHAPLPSIRLARIATTGVFHRISVRLPSGESHSKIFKYHPRTLEGLKEDVDKLLRKMYPHYFEYKS